MRKFLSVVIILVFSLFLSACTANTSMSEGYVNGSTMSGSNSQDSTTDEALPVFSLEELAKYDGKNGNKAYVAVEGKVYDVTLVTAWAQGVHQGNIAGNDLTEAIKQSPHGKSVLSSLPVVGTLEE